MPLYAVWNRKIDLIEGHRASVICNDGRTYEGIGAVRLDFDDGHFVILTESEIKNYEILD